MKKVSQKKLCDIYHNNTNIIYVFSLLAMTGSHFLLFYQYSIISHDEICVSMYCVYCIASFTFSMAIVNPETVKIGSGQSCSNLAVSCYCVHIQCLPVENIQQYKFSKIFQLSMSKFFRHILPVSTCNSYLRTCS